MSAVRAVSELWLVRKPVEYEMKVNSRTGANDNMLLKRTLSTPDLGEVYEIATQELGMVPVTRGHIRTYYRSNREFVYQTENIPIFGY